ncbi:MAG: selenocysteine-specific translation elongation factor [Phycisphaerae bacterium]|jgi:selenocysteine-specific elongation factor|nr:selenocysteine-specific translation elongation factor [Phycisphaerae bacterium]MDP7286502.1 selenocysteine-specific translation elongation factor [Phycisphaerae bacterium]
MGQDRKNIMLGTAGHVDHGKTALVKVLTGCNTDTLAVEQQRGLTIELGFAPCQMYDDRIVGIVDVPGHVGFIRNMVAGAQGIDVVILVVAADDGVMPQTREHLDILTLMGVQHGLTALTKTDAVDAELCEMARDDVRSFVAGTFLEDAPICPVSNITGSGFPEFMSAMNKAVDACESREIDGLFRLWVERSFTIRGFGTVVSGIPSSGKINVGDELRIARTGKTARVRGVEVYGRESQTGMSGECVAINLVDVDAADVPRGSLVCDSDVYEPAHMVEAELNMLTSAHKPMKDYAEVHVHVGTAEVMANVAMLQGGPIGPGESQFVQLRMKSPLSLAPGERFVVRAPGPAGINTTLGGGRILDTSDKRLRRNRPWTLEKLTAMRDALDSPAQWAAIHLKQAGAAVTAEALARLAKAPLVQTADALKTLTAKRTARKMPDGKFICCELIDQTADAIVEALDKFHQANPARGGLSRADLAAEIDTGAGLFAPAIDGLLADGDVEQADMVLGLPGKGTRLSEEDRDLCDRIEKLLIGAGLAPPLPADIADQLGVSETKLVEMTAVLSDRGRAVQLDRKVILHNDAVEAAKAVVLDLFAKSAIFTTMEFRDALGASRKVAVPLLDHLDSLKYTVRTANRRKSGAEARKLLSQDR